MTRSHSVITEMCDFQDKTIAKAPSIRTVPKFGHNMPLHVFLSFSSCLKNIVTRTQSSWLQIVFLSSKIQQV